MTEEETREWRAEFHRALGNPVRLEILDYLLEGEQCQCDIFPRIGLSQSTVSAYLSQMVRADILKVRKDGVRKLYSLSSPEVRDIVGSTRRLALKRTG